VTSSPAGLFTAAACLVPLVLGAGVSLGVVTALVGVVVVLLGQSLHGARAGQDPDPGAWSSGDGRASADR
jgi:hypothetical protein